MTKPMLGYVRVSRVGARTKEDGFISPEQQEEAIQRWCAARNIHVIMMPHELNRSGGTMDRPVFNECMKQVERGEAGGIVVYKTDRFARTLLGAISTLGELQKHGASFASTSEPDLDYTNTQGRMFMQMLFVFAEFLRSSLKDTWRANSIDAVMKKGIHVAPYGAFGYDKDPKTKRLVPNADAAHVRRVFEMRGEDGYTWAAIAEWLNQVAPQWVPVKDAEVEEGQEAPLELKAWTAQAVQRLCSRRVYLGEAFYGLHSNTENREFAHNREAHEPIVTEEVWSRAQMDPSIRRGGPSMGQTESNALLGGGIVRCAGCRYTMTMGKRTDGDGNAYPMYRCRGSYAGGKCPSPSNISADRLEAFVVSEVAELLEGLQTQGVPDSSEIEALERELLESREAYESFRRDRRARRNMTADEWNDDLEGYKSDVTKAERELSNALDRTGRSMDIPTIDEFLSAPLEEKRKHIHSALDCIVVRRSSGRGRNATPVAKRALILWKGTAPDDLPRKRVFGGAIKSFDWPGGEPEAGMLAA